MSERRRLRRPPALHRPPAAPAPVTPDEVLERAPDVSRETSWESLGRYVAGGQVPPEPEPETYPPLRKDQVARLEALTAVWERSVRLEGPADATLLYAAPPPPPPPRREAVPTAEPLGPPPVPDEEEVRDRSEVLLEEEAAAHELEAVPDRDPDPGRPPVRVSDWTSRHDPASLEYPVRQLLARPVPLQDVALLTGPVLDQGTVPPLSVHDASACVGMASAAAANVLVRRGPAGLGHDVLEDDARRLYDRAQDLDAISGHDYAGTSVLAGMKAGQEAGWWPAYLWALGGTRDVAQVLLQLRLAVVVGIPWSAQLEEPDAAGVIRPGGEDRGGHALAVVGLRLQVAGQPGPWFELQQSRGRTEGLGGHVFIHHKDLARLLAGVGEAAVPLPGELG